ncbi:MAG: tetratricopeptide repeat protein [Cyclobacteriaceae bacterium]|nr:tetratricopeptide repeat protein [Cyclobacteriaceae bacterium]
MNYLKVPLIILILCLNISASAQQSLIFTQKDRWYREGIELLQREKFSSARHAFEKYLKEGEDRIKLADAQYYIAYCGIKLNNRDGQGLVRQFIHEYPDHPKVALAYYELGNIKYEEKKYKEAIRYYEQIDLAQLGRESRDDAQFKWAYSYFSQQQFDKSLKLFNDLKRTDNKYTHASNYYAGYIYFQKGLYDMAYTDFKRAEKNEYYARIVPELLVKIYYKQRRYDDLIDYANSVLKSGKPLSNESEFYLYLAESWYRKGDFIQALVYFDLYANTIKDPVDYQVLFRIADAKQRTGREREAIEDFKTVALQSDTIGQYGTFYLGNLYLKYDNKAFAMAAFRKARDGNYNRFMQEEAALNYAKLSYEQGMHQAAIQEFLSFKQKYPDSPYTEEVNDLLTEAYFRTNNYEEAIKHFENIPFKSERVRKAYQKMTYLQGTEFFNDKKFFSAVQLFDKSLQYPVDNELVINANFWKGEAYSIGNKYDDAINAYSAVFRADPNGRSLYYLRARYGIAHAYFNRKEYDKALGHFQYFTERANRNTQGNYYEDAMVRLADCYYANKNYDRALQVLGQVLAENRSQKDYAYFRRGVIHGINGNLEQANRSFDEVIQRYPNSNYFVDALFQKGQFNFESGNYANAIAQFNNVVRNHPQSKFVPYALQSRALANSNLRNYASTASDYKEILEKYPGHPVAKNALLGLQQTLSTMGNPEEFDQYLAQFRNANPRDGDFENIEFESARNLYFGQKYENAISAFRRFITQYPESSNILEARYFIADSYYRLDQPGQSLEGFYELSTYPNYSRYIRVIQRIAELEEEMGNYPAAIWYYNRFASTSTSRRDQQQAFMGLVNNYYLLGKYDSSAYFSNRILDGGQAVAGAETFAHLYLGKSALQQNKNAQAREFFQKTVSIAKDEYAAEAQYHLSEMLFKAGNYRKSIESLYDLNSQFGTYPLWLGKSFLLIAENYMGLNETFQAQATLESVIEYSPVEEIKQQARIRLEQIMASEKNRRPQSGDTLEISNPESKQIRN